MLKSSPVVKIRSVCLGVGCKHYYGSLSSLVACKLDEGLSAALNRDQTLLRMSERQRQMEEFLRSSSTPPQGCQYVLEHIAANYARRKREEKWRRRARNVHRTQH